jgi:hypothetical protein
MSVMARLRQPPFANHRQVNRFLRVYSSLLVRVTSACAHRSLNSQPMPMVRVRRTYNCEKGC